MPWKDETELLAFARKLEGKKFSEISESIGKLDENHRKHTKGVAAKVIETGYFEIPSNSSEHPDFEELGIELKVSPPDTYQGGHLHNQRTECHQNG